MARDRRTSRRRREGSEGTSLTQYTQQTLYNTHSDVEFARARSGMDGQQLYRALQTHITEIWSEMVDGQPVEGSTIQFDWRRLGPILADAGVRVVDGIRR